MLCYITSVETVLTCGPLCARTVQSPTSGNSGRLKTAWAIPEFGRTGSLATTDPAGSCGQDGTTVKAGHTTCRPSLTKHGTQHVDPQKTWYTTGNNPPYKTWCTTCRPSHPKHGIQHVNLPPTHTHTQHGVRRVDPHTQNMVYNM